jgi:hypothetical protein
MRPFERITYTEDERDKSKWMWTEFSVFWDKIRDDVPEGPEKTLCLRKLQEALYYFEIAHTNHCKQERSK